MRNPSASVAHFSRSILSFDATVAVYEALSTMRESRNHIAVVVDPGTGAVIGLVTITDVLQRLLPAAGFAGDRAPRV
ncbi:CBS domain-containing protein [Nocardia brasiliensis]|uniref:CBS domain-containing protein n=1 Tax=Nocardia brasiliensis TaxID=37326 RepID=UPI003D8C82AD